MIKAGSSTCRRDGAFSMGCAMLGKCHSAAMGVEPKQHEMTQSDIPPLPSAGAMIPRAPFWRTIGAVLPRAAEAVAFAEGR